MSSALSCIERQRWFSGPAPPSIPPCLRSLIHECRGGCCQDGGSNYTPGTEQLSVAKTKHTVTLPCECTRRKGNSLKFPQTHETNVQLDDEDSRLQELLFRAEPQQRSALKQSRLSQGEDLFKFDVFIILLPPLNCQM